MLRFLPVVVEIALLVYSLFDCVQAEESEIRNLPRFAWLLLIVIVPVIGPIVWLVAGRPPRPAPWRASASSGDQRTLAPDDDPGFLASIKSSDDLHEQMLTEWEAQLRERERRLREREPDDPEPPEPAR